MLKSNFKYFSIQTGYAAFAFLFASIFSAVEFVRLIVENAPIDTIFAAEFFKTAILAAAAQVMFSYRKELCDANSIRIGFVTFFFPSIILLTFVLAVAFKSDIGKLIPECDTALESSALFVYRLLQLACRWLEAESVYIFAIFAAEFSKLKKRALKNACIFAAIFSLLTVVSFGGRATIGLLMFIFLFAVMLLKTPNKSR